MSLFQKFYNLAALNFTNDNHCPGYDFGIVKLEGLVEYKSGGYSNLELRSIDTSQSLFRIASMTKSFVAIAILHLRDQGLLNLDDLAEVTLPELSSIHYPTPDSPRIRIHNLLSMTAGFPEDNRWADRKLDESKEQMIFSRGTNTGVTYDISSTRVLNVFVQTSPELALTRFG